MSRQQRLQQRAAHRAALRRRRLIAGTLLALVVGVSLMLTVDPTLGVAVGVLTALGAVWLAQRA